MCWRDRIEQKPEVLVGKPVIKGTRLSVEFILDRLADEWSMDELLDSYSHITREDIEACLRFASDVVHADYLARKHA
jgi:uncharacterized protein (DUF433 family)